MKEFLSANGINFAYVDISEGMFNLKQYLKFRDTRPEFNEIIKQGRVGIPFISVNNGEKLYFENPNINELL